ncbi:lysophospholipase L1-like esterase [Roseivirga ehrenbergii]|nr:SGNH/GDSL hydrolase family protein [Roseivirga ehrenbergii]TCL14299.1 lysophospholipase L1-like esterase [Roseivirga ehrenbergii]
MKQRLPLLALLVIFISLLSMNSLPAQKTDNQTAAKTYLALGDSYTIGESVAESERWPMQLAARLVHEGIPMKDPKIIAKTGWRTDDLKAAIEADNELLESYDLVSLLIGVNNQYQGRSVESFAPEFEELLQIAIKYAGGKKENVFVVSIPDYGKTPFGAAKEDQIKKELDAYNKVSKNIAKKYGVAYYNITPISRMAKSYPELIANDDLHPSGKMYTKWVELFEKKVEKMLKK